MRVEPTINIEFASDQRTETHLKSLEHQLKEVKGVEYDLLEPKDHRAPALFVIGLEKKGGEAEDTAQSVAQLLYNFLHQDATIPQNARINLVTAEGDRTDIGPLSVQEIREIIITAHTHQ